MFFTPTTRLAQVSLIVCSISWCDGLHYTTSICWLDCLNYPSSICRLHCLNITSSIHRLHCLHYPSSICRLDCLHYTSKSRSGIGGCNGCSRHGGGPIISRC